MTNLDRPEEALEIYKLRMKIEESLKDLKSLPKLDKIMNKSQEYLEKMIDMVMLAFYHRANDRESIRETSYKGKNAENYSGLFIFLKRLRQIPLATIVAAIASALALFKYIVLGFV